MQIKELPADLFSGQFSISSLTSIDLSHNMLGDGSAVSIPSSGSPPSFLTLLDFSCAPSFCFSPSLSHIHSQLSHSMVLQCNAMQVERELEGEQAAHLDGGDDSDEEGPEELELRVSHPQLALQLSSADYPRPHLLFILAVHLRPVCNFTSSSSSSSLSPFSLPLCSDCCLMRAGVTSARPLIASLILSAMFLFFHPC